ncbi:glycosyltransferase [Cohnella nanjingensis]|uniref:Glycosyltransferase n=1 Tax=Cohnella nanjingensis TaxID=1387779 RepID=A0A7X0RSQ7_9BACL|nr:glycosyltransferase [Cohnella nanjingensis]MBB6671509.1 glycosyltransferase [Cohnella nanjingensis]
MLTSIVIATFNKLDYTQQCIESIRTYTDAGTYEIIVVDNCSTDGTVEWLSQQADIKSICNAANEGFPRACNQGIEIASGENILLLNNDTVVTERWLSQLTASLYSSEDIGAVGSVTNNCSYAQTIPVDYASMAEMQTFAGSYNHADPNLWDERLKLIGYCMLIKKSVVDQIGLLDERFTPGNYEDDDYSLRIRLAGYKLLLCKDTFIHHYGSVSFREAPPAYLELMRNNRQKFSDKWGYDPEREATFRHDLRSLLNKGDPNMSIRFLEIGSGCGGNLLEVRNGFPYAELFGTERSARAADIAERSGASIFVGAAENIIWELPEGAFDYILVSESMAEWPSPATALARLRALLKPEGILLAYVPNAMHVHRLRALLRGEVGPRQLNGFTLQEAQELFQSAAFDQIQISGVKLPLSEKDRLQLQHLAQAAGLDETLAYELSEFLFLASSAKENIEPESNPDRIKEVVNGILMQEDMEANITALVAYDVDEVAAVIDHAGGEQREELTNYLAVQLLERQELKLAQKYLQQAFEWNPNHESTIFNFGLVAYRLDQLDLALEWFELLPTKSEQIQTWIQKIQFEKNQGKPDEKKFVFLLRRIEQDIDREESLQELVTCIQMGEVTPDQLQKIAQIALIEKAEVLTQVAIFAFNTGVFDSVLALFEAALALEPNHDSANYHLAEVLSILGEKELALTYLDRVSHVFPSLQQLKDQLRGA